MNITETDLRRLAEVMKRNNLSVDQVIEIIDVEGKKNRKTLKSSYPLSIEIDYSKSFDEQTSACKCDWIDPDVNEENFISTIEVDKEKTVLFLKLFFCHDDCKEGMVSEEIIEKMKKDNYRPAILCEILALGTSYPWLQTQFPILALGSIWDDSKKTRYVPRIYVEEKNRIVDTGFFDSTWTGGFAFLGISLGNSNG